MTITYKTLTKCIALIIATITPKREIAFNCYSPCPLCGFHIRGSNVFETYIVKNDIVRVHAECANQERELAAQSVGR